MPHSRNRSGFTLIETLIASAIIAITATSVYYAFLRMNNFAVASRCDTAAKIVLERAVNLAMTSDWRATTPPILTLTNPTTSKPFQPFNVDTGVDDDNATVSLFTDPNSNSVITGVLSRQVVAYPVPAGKPPLGDLYRVTFRLDFKVHKRADEPVTSVYAYTLRASDK